VKLDRNRYLESRSLKPSTLLIALVLVNLVLGLVVWVFPAEGVSFGTIGKLKFVSFSELSGSSDLNQKVVDIDSVLKGVSPNQAIVKIKQSDSSIGKQGSNNANVAVAKVPGYRSLQLPPNNPNALRTLKYGLYVESKSKVIRILHYGDSQLEGDRITDFFRNRMQEVFGGGGPGIVMPNEPAAAARRAAIVSHSKNIKKNAFYVKGSQIKDGTYGIGGTAFTISGPHSRFVDWERDSNQKKTARFNNEKQVPTYIKILNGHLGYSKTKKYDRITLLYGSKEPFQVKLTCDNYVNDYTLEPASAGIETWNIPTKSKLQFDFTAGEFPNLYGVALDGTTGVAVDNFAMRGSSAVGFDKIAQSVYSHHLKALNVRAIVLQYGINVVPNVRSDYGYYKTILIRQLKNLKAAYPGVTIIVIGPSDMSQKRGGEMVSYSNIPLIRDAMQDAAFASDCCFWDLYEAMGGQNSMDAWVKKGLAQKDYTHFSYKGASYVGEMFYEALMEKLTKEVQ
jgi:hypothetical protein